MGGKQMHSLWVGGWTRAPAYCLTRGAPAISTAPSLRGNLRIGVLNREIALNGAIVFTVPTAVVRWIDRVQGISVAVIHFCRAVQMYGNGSAIVERRVRIPRIVRASARLQIQAVCRTAGRSNANGRRSRTRQRHLRPRPGRKVFRIQHWITDRVKECDPRNRDAAAFAGNERHFVELFARAEISAGAGRTGISAVSREGDGHGVRAG